MLDEVIDQMNRFPLAFVVHDATSRTRTASAPTSATRR
jgi:hypothetical protein